MIELLIARFGAGVFKYAAVVFAVVASFVAFSFHEQNKGAAKAVLKIEKQDATNVKKAQAAGARSRDPRTRGVLDPYQRADD